MKKLDNNIFLFLCRLGYNIQRAYYRRFPARISTESGRPYTRDMAKNCVGKGWASLIDRIYDRIEAINTRTTILQVKEKFGGLRFYFTAHEDFYEYISRVVDECESDSFKMCEVCGEPGIERQENYWIRTACEAH